MILVQRALPSQILLQEDFRPGSLSLGLWCMGREQSRWLAGSQRGILACASFVKDHPSSYWPCRVVYLLDVTQCIDRNHVTRLRRCYLNLSALDLVPPFLCSKGLLEVTGELALRVGVWARAVLLSPTGCQESQFWIRVCVAW